MNSKRIAVRLALLWLAVIALFFSHLQIFSAQSDNAAKLGTLAKMIFGRYESQWKAYSARELRSVDSSVEALKSLVALDVDGSEPMLSVAVFVRDQGRELRDRGYPIQAQIDGLVTLKVPVADLQELSNLASVVYVEPSKIDHPLSHDVSVPETRAALARQAFNLSGKNVIVGVIDTGIDWRHADFRGPDGKTRIKFLWDMSDNRGPEPADLPGAGGTVYTEQQINSALGGSGAVVEADRVGHGSHVAGSAAGNGLATGGGFPTGTFTGMAPEADIIFVKAIRNDNSGFTQTDQIAALEFIDHRAGELGKPYVVNMSLGGHAGSHDATAANEQWIDKLVGPGIPGKVVCISAGNEGANDIHASGSIAPGSTETVSFSVRSTSTLEAVDIWYSGADSFDITVMTPGNQTTPPISPGGKFSGTASDGTDVNIESQTANSLNNSKEIFVLLSKSGGQPIASGTWSLQLRRASGNSGRFDAWIIKNSRFVDHIDGSSRVGMPGTARNAITVASYITKYRWTDVDGNSRDYRGWGPAFDASVFSKSPFSGPGPTRDGRQKPEIAAPGQGIASVNSADAGTGREYIVPDGKHAIMQGTSMACPHVTGAVALMLQANPRLDAAQVRDYLTRTARADDFTSRVPNYDFGYGKMDVYEAIKAIRGNAGGTPPPQAPVITAVEPNTIQRGTTVQMSVTGLNFTGTLGVEFAPSSGITVNSKGIVAPNRISISLNIASSATAGIYQIFVTTDGRRSNPGVFQVITPGGPSPDPQDPYEPNDDMEHATPVPANPISARIYPRTDIDVFKFSATAGRTVTFDIDAGVLSPSSSLDSIIGVFDQYGNLLDFNDDDGRTLDSYLQWTPDVTATYYIAVASYSSNEEGPSTSGPYVLKISGYAGDLRNDNTPPILETKDIHVPDFLSKTTELFGSWQARDPESGIDHYEYAVGSSPGGSDVVPFTRTTNNSVVLGGLSLQTGARYYLSVKAYNGAGLASQLAISEGTTVDVTKRMFPLYFPRVVAFAGSFTGIALVNTGTFPAQVTYRLYDNNGNLSLGAGIKNPTVRTLNSREQLPILTTELFAPPSSNAPGWVQIDSTSPDVQGFYLYGADDLSFLDGADVSGKTLTDFVFHRVQDTGNDVFTSISLVNPNDADATATLDLHDKDGRLLSSQTLSLSAKRRVVKFVRDLFPGITQLTGGTIRVRSNPGLVGFELFTTQAADLGGMNPQSTGDAARQVFFAQLVSLTDWYTELSVTNPNDNPIDVELTALTEAGDIIPAGQNPLRVRIPAWGQYNTPATAFQFPASVSIVGYVSAKVISGNGGIFGNVVFGTRYGAVAALPIQTQGSKSMVFSQVAQNDFFFTGVTLLNPGQVAANVTTQVFDAEGRSLGSFTETFAAGRKKARVIWQIVSGVLNRSAGYVTVTSDQPIIGFELFGGTDLQRYPFLAAVPPQVPSTSSAEPIALAAESHREATPVLRTPRFSSNESLYLKLYRAVKGEVRREDPRRGWVH